MRSGHVRPESSVTFSRNERSRSPKYAYAASVRRFGAGQASLSIHLIPMFGAFMSALLLGESIHTYDWLGILMILSGLAFATLRLPIWKTHQTPALTPRQAS
jgi:EamA domain-containing membrane protein RarD